MWSNFIICVAPDLVTPVTSVWAWLSRRSVMSWTGSIDDESLSLFMSTTFWPCHRQWTCCIHTSQSFQHEEQDVMLVNNINSGLLPDVHQCKMEAHSGHNFRCQRCASWDSWWCEDWLAWPLRSPYTRRMISSSHNMPACHHSQENMFMMCATIQTCGAEVIHLFSQCKGINFKSCSHQLQSDKVKQC